MPDSSGLARLHSTTRLRTLQPPRRAVRSCLTSHYAALEYVSPSAALLARARGILRPSAP